MDRGPNSSDKLKKNFQSSFRFTGELCKAVLYLLPSPSTASPSAPVQVEKSHLTFFCYFSCSPTLLSPPVASVLLISLHPLQHIHVTALSVKEVTSSVCCVPKTSPVTWDGGCIITPASEKRNPKPKENRAQKYLRTRNQNHGTLQESWRH